MLLFRDLQSVYWIRGARAVATFYVLRAITSLTEPLIPPKPSTLNPLETLSLEVPLKGILEGTLKGSWASSGDAASVVTRGAVWVVASAMLLRGPPPEQALGPRKNSVATGLEGAVL